MNNKDYKNFLKEQFVPDTEIKRELFVYAYKCCLSDIKRLYTDSTDFDFAILEIEKKISEFKTI